MNRLKIAINNRDLKSIQTEYYKLIECLYNVPESSTDFKRYVAIAALYNTYNVRNRPLKYYLRADFASQYGVLGESDMETLRLAIGEQEPHLELFDASKNMLEKRIPAIVGVRLFKDTIS